ncbi:MAG: hypothetical protein ACRELE_00890 [Gemmatimonadales bacterium]
MTRITVRRASRNSPPPIGALILGFGVSVALGFALGELAGPAVERTLAHWTRPDTPENPVRVLVAAAQAALDGDLILRDARLVVIPVGRAAIELHGWVTDRRARARAARLVGDAVPAESIINCLLVHGEDDLALLPDEPDADELLA